MSLSLDWYPRPVEREHVGVQAHGHLLFHRPVEGIGHGVLPERFGQRRNVGGVNLLVR
jgi:hypothetical protein